MGKMRDYSYKMRDFYKRVAAFPLSFILLIKEVRKTVIKNKNC